MKNKITFLLFSFATLFFVSCSDFLEVEDKSFITEDENTLSSPNDSVYTLAGILTGLQDVGTQTVILGELRGDLTDVVDEYADRYLKELNSHYISRENPYTDITPFYNVINNCNYAIAKMDTVVKNKALLPD